MLSCTALNWCGGMGDIVGRLAWDQWCGGMRDIVERLAWDQWCGYGGGLHPSSLSRCCP